MTTDTHDPKHQEFLCPTDAIDCDSPEVITFAESISSAKKTDVDKCIALFHAVRDGFRYDPYRIDLTLAGMRASTTLRKGYGFCIPKAVLLAASARAIGVPSRLGFADVKNHLATPRLLELMQTDLFVFHGYTELFLKDQWLKATPAFNKSLCERFNVEPLEFNGEEDAVLQQADRAGNEFMQYVRDRGWFADLPVEQIRAGFFETYPALASAHAHQINGSFEDEVEA